jgi:hypothetical protein
MPSTRQLRISFSLSERLNDVGFADGDCAKKEAGKDFPIYLVTEMIRESDTLFEISLQSRTHWCIVKMVRKHKDKLEKLSENIMLLKG